MGPRRRAPRYPNGPDKAMEELIAANALRFYEYYHEQSDTLISGCVVGELLYRAPTQEHCVTMKRVMDQHIMHLASTGQPMHEIMEFLISLVSTGRPDSQDDRFKLFNSRSINLLLAQMANVHYMVHSLDAYSDYDGENLVVALLKYVDSSCLKLMNQLLDSCIILTHIGVSSLLASMAPQTTVDGRTVSAILHPPRVFKCYNWIAYWAYGKYSGNTATDNSGPMFWMDPVIYNTSIALLNCKTTNDEIGMSKKVRTRIQRTLEYYFTPTAMHISATMYPHLTYYNQWRFNNRLCEQLRRLLLQMVNNSGFIKSANNVAAQYNIKYTGSTAIASMAPAAVSPSSSATSAASPRSTVQPPRQRQRQMSMPTQAIQHSTDSVSSTHSHDTVSAACNGATSGIATDTDDSSGELTPTYQMTCSTSDMETVQITHKKTLVLVDGRNMFYKLNSPMTHDINLTAMKSFLSPAGQTTLYVILGEYIRERFGVNLAEHEYQQFHVVVIFHERHRKVLESCFPRDPVTGIRGPPQDPNITYMYTPGSMNDDIVALYLWLSNPGSILLTSDDHSNYIANVTLSNTYLRTLYKEWQRLFRITQAEYVTKCKTVTIPNMSSGLNPYRS